MPSTVWRGYVSFGLISIPVRLFRAARAEKIGFRRVYRQPATHEADSEPEEPAVPEPVRGRGVERFSKPEARSDLTEAKRSDTPVQQVFTRVKQASIGSDNETVLPDSVVKGYEYEKDRFVEVGREELKSIAPKTSSTMDIQEFVQLAEVDPVYFETSYYLVPEQAGQKAYALLYKAMANTGLVAVAQFAMHSREHVILLRPGRSGLLAHTMFFANEVHADEEYRPDTSLVSEKELALAETLIHSLDRSFEPEKYRDSYRDRLESLLARKVQGLPAAPQAAVPKTAEVLDIAEALRRSLANLKKPPSSAEAPAKTAAEPVAERASRRSSKRHKSA